jgi:hypothetical protein
MATRCEMIVGFLVPHQCERSALGQCVQCSRQYCEEHLNVRVTGLLCIACEQGLDRPVVLPPIARSYTTDDLDAFTRESVDDSDDLFSDLS